LDIYIYIYNNQKALCSKVRKTCYVNWWNICMVWSNLLIHGIYILFWRSLKGVLLTIMFIFNYFKAISMWSWLCILMISFWHFMTWFCLTKTKDNV
jgi:hypothetical protein